MGKDGTLFIRGLASQTTAKGLAMEFEPFGDLLRCDIPFSQGVSKG